MNKPEINEEAQINREIVNIFNDYLKSNKKNEITKYAPIQYPKFKENALLFVGFNPSDSIKLKYQSLLDYKKNPGKALQTALEIENIYADPEWREERHPYFSTMHRMYKECQKDFPKLQFQHVDLFIFRHTNQKKAEEFVYPKGELTDFGKKQLNLFYKIVSLTKPAIILVANAKSSEIISEKLKQKLNDDGYNTLTVDGREYPILYSSMLSGQRALDVYSRERLVWHIKKILRKK